MKTHALLMTICLSLAACGPGGPLSDSGGELNEKGDTSPVAFAGNFKVKSLKCGKAPAIATTDEFVVTRDTSLISWVYVTEDNDTQICKHIDGFGILIRERSRRFVADETPEEKPEDFMKGSFQRIQVGTACWRKINGMVESVPYQQEVKNVSGATFSGTLTQTDFGPMKFQSAKSPFCNDEATTIELVN